MNVLNLYTYLQTSGFKVTSFNSDNATISIEGITSAEVLALIAGLNANPSISVTIQLVALLQYNLVVTELD